VVKKVLLLASPIPSPGERIAVLVVAVAAWKALIEREG